jgi:hypothetical protein
LLFFGGRGKSQRNASSSSGGGGDPNVLEAQVRRDLGSNGAGVAQIMVPVPPATIVTVADLDDVVIEIDYGSGFVEQAVELEARGQHPDGSYKVIGGRVDVTSISSGSPLTARVTLSGSPTVARTTVAGAYDYVRSASDPRLSGHPAVVLIPTDPDYLVTTQLTGPYALQTRAAVVALGGQHELFWERLEDFSDWWWSTSAGSGTYGHAPAGDNTMSVQACNTSNASYPSFGDLTSSTSDFEAWRVALAYVGASVYPFNSYDSGKMMLEAWLSSGNYAKFGIRGQAYIAWYANEYIPFQSTGVNGFAAFPDGCAAYYNLNGDPAGKDAIERIADRFFRAVPSYFATPGGSPDGYGIGYGALLSDAAGTERGLDQRETARIWQTALAGHRVRSTTTYDGVDRYAIDYEAEATEIRDRILLTGAENRMLKSDGTWRNARCDDASGMYESPFMQLMLCLEAMKHIDTFGADAALQAAIVDFWDYLYTTSGKWGIWDYNFTGAPEDWETATIKSFRQDFGFHCAALDSPHPNNGDASTLTLMYPALPAWLYRQTATAAYLTQADEVFGEGIGTSTTYGSGPTIGELGSGQLVSRKVFGEAQHAVMQYFTYRLGA